MLDGENENTELRTNAKSKSNIRITINNANESVEEDEDTADGKNNNDNTSERRETGAKNKTSQNPKEIGEGVKLLAKQEEDKGKEVVRGHWENSLDFLVSCLGYAVGLGNIWRFPFLCFRHGGGIFLIPYFLMLVFAGLPVFFLEVSLGQYAGVGPIQVFGRLAPVAGGLGIAVVCVSIFLAFFYNVVVSWSIWYLVATFTGMEWESCNHWYNTQNCWSRKAHLKSLKNQSSSVEEYFDRYVLGNQDNDWYNFGYPRWQSVLALGSAWGLVALCLMKGVKSSGKVVYVTSLLPYLVLFFLAVRGFTLPGAWDGISLFLSPEWSHLSDLSLWTDAATQVIFSLGPACGCVITLSSYNSFTRKSHKDAVLIALCNSLTSILSGLVVFSILGFMAHEANLEVKDVVQSGPGLAFIVYPEVVTMLGGSQFWSALFFLMLISLALGSIFGAFETVLTALSDFWPQLRAYKPRTVCITSLAMFILGLPFTCNGGIHMFNLFNSSAPSWNLLLFALLEVLIVSYVYGVDRFLENLGEMGMKMPHYARMYWKVAWKYSTPGVLFVLLVLSWINFGHVGYKGTLYPTWVQVMGYLITGSTVIALPVVAVMKLMDLYQESSGNLKSLVLPTAQWGPSTDADSFVTLVP